MKNNRNLILLSILFTIIIQGCKDHRVSENSIVANTENTFMNPLLDSGADPWTIYHEGNYYYIKSGAKGIILLKTPDITDLRNAESKVIWTAPATGDHSKNVWAPEIHVINGKWYVYVAADDGDNRNHRMFVLENTSANPFEGTFVVKSKLKTDVNDNWAIDGSIFEHKGNLYFIWSGWEKPKEITETQNIYIARMSNPWTISSERVLLSTPELEWEKNWNYPDAWTPEAPVYVNEGPQMLSHGDKIHIIYSASGCWTPYYALGILTADINSNLMDKTSWTKAKEPIFKQSEENKVYGTGHNSFFKSPDGKEDWVLYHANDNPADGCGNKRSPRAQKMSWDSNNMPVLGIPYPTSMKLMKPSGIMK
tara:strand:+ start:121258 stop:122355 length:1098 start_codon:yes stop_codon:yes gene_type:complete